jgi:hypothetical protein
VRREEKRREEEKRGEAMYCVGLERDETSKS